MKHLRMIQLVTCASLALLFGCGGDSSGGGTGPTGNGTFSAGLDGSKMLSSLSADDTQKLCAAGEKFLAANPAIPMDLCKILGLFATAFGDPKSDAEVQKLCQEGYDQCISTGGMTKCTAIPTTCKATVSQMEACWSAAAAWLHSATADIACNKLTLKDAQPSGGERTPPAKPAACKVLEDMGCADLDVTGP
jgi:hypothetical protein